MTEFRDDDAGSEALRSLAERQRARLRGPQPGFEDRVMARMREARAPKRAPLLWIMSPSAVRVRPVWIPLAAAALLVVWLAGSRYGARSGSGAAPAAAAVAAVPGARSDTVYVRFEFVAPGVQDVRLAGDFTGWRPDKVALERQAGNVWVATVPLAVGEHRYQFVVDGKWLPDPRAQAVDDEFGGHNSVIVIGPNGQVRS